MSTKQDLLARCARLERTVDPLEMALHDLIHGDVTWFGRGDCRIGVSRPRGACGGIVCWQFEGSTGADYFEQWSRNQLEHISACITGENNEANAILMRRRVTVELAMRFVADQQRAA